MDHNINNLNRQLSIKLKADFELARTKVLKIKATYPSIIESLRLFLDFNVEKFKEQEKKDLINRQLPAWLEYQKESAANVYDCLLFEYSDQETPPYEAFSCALYNMRKYKLTIEPHYFEYAEDYWTGGSGPLLEPFSFCEPFHINVLTSSEEYDKVHFEDKNSGAAEIKSLADALCKMVFNEVFSEADNNGLFSGLKLKAGGIFMYAIHDGGNVQNPFYIKS
jgi:hypothetical protein